MTIKCLLNTRQMGEIIIGIENRKYNRDLALGEKVFDKGPTKKVKRGCND